MYTILIAHGVNLDLLKQRPVNLYGGLSLAEVDALVEREAGLLAKELAIELSLSFFQSNDEGAWLAKIAEPFDGMLLNPAAWTHSSLALADRLEAIATPFVEVHLSNLAAREKLRQHSLSAPYAIGVVYGFGAESYRLALRGLVVHLANKASCQQGS